VREISRAVVELRGATVSIRLIEQNALAASAVADPAGVLETGASALEGLASPLAGDPRVIRVCSACDPRVIRV
jgi:branched-chain amino acid transport system ATP-binding protein